MSNLLEQASLVLIPSGYKQSVVYSEIPIDGSGDLDFSRASDATRVNSLGLVEKVRTNLLSYSQDFSNAYWNGSTGVVSNSTTAPDGTTTADTNNSGGVYPASPWGGDATIPNTASIYAKANPSGASTLQLGFNRFGAGDYIVCVFNLSNGTAGAVTLGGSAVYGTAQITSVGNGWYRCSLTGICSTSAGTLSFNPVNSCYIWGAQVEVSDFGPTAYIPTTSSAVSVGPYSNIPRLNYQNGGGGCPSLLLEAQRTNLAVYSEQFDNAAWSKITAGTASSPVVTANYTTSPDGYQNADRIQFASNTTSAGNFSLLVSNTINLTSIGTYTMYVKSLTSSTQNLLVYWGGGQGSVFQVTTEWTRITLTGLSVTNEPILFGTRGGSGSFFNGGDATLDIAVWGAQLEQGSYASSYIPTLGTSVTRVADYANKSSISALFGASATSFFIDFVKKANATGWTITGGNGSKLFSICQFDSTSGVPRIVFDDGVDTSSTLSALSNGRHKIAISYATNDTRVYIDGSLVLTNTSCTYYQYDRLGINATAWTGFTNNTNNFELNQFVQFPIALTNAQLAELTA